jgi:phytoene synthase
VSTEVSDQITQKSASNLALAFVLLPKRKRAAMSALYAFCREVDDIADEDSLPVPRRRELLGAWREDIRKTCGGGAPEFAVNRELQPFVAEFKLPFPLFEELIKGVEMDLDQDRYPDPTALEAYCYRVASVVGLLSIEIFGYTDPRCREYADALGKALQLTNILRDIGNDAARGRIYVPQSELVRFGVTEEEILHRRSSDRFERLAESLAGRARDFYCRARALLPARDRQAMVAAELMGSVYWKLLRKLETRGFPVLADEPTRLGKTQKLALVFLAWCRVKTGVPLAGYGA